MRPMILRKAWISCWLSAVAFACMTGQGAAHEAATWADLSSGHPGGGIGWTLDPWITLPLAAATILYAGGTFRLRHRRAKGWTRAAAFWAGLLTLGAALASPLHSLGGQLFTAHMIEHELVMAIAAPLLVLARPAAVLLWGLPAPLRRRAAGAMALPAMRTTWFRLSAPVTATVLHGLAIWFWHIPFVFESTLAVVSIHRLQHVTFLASAILFWWSMLRRSEFGAAALHLFLTMLHMSLLGALLVVAPRVLFAVQTSGAGRWGLTPLEDQQLAGLIMWVPAGTIYAAACLAFMATWIRRAGAQPWRVPDVAPPA